MITPEMFFNNLYYRSLPQVYRDEDKDLVLKRYLESLNEGGFKDVLYGENSIVNIVNPLKCPDSVLPVLSACYGLEYYPTIPAKYYRKMLSNIIELNRRRGTYSCLKYLCRVLTGMDITTSYVGSKTSRVLYIDLIASSMQDVADMDLSVKVVNLFIKNFIPYYITSIEIKSVVDDVILDNPIYRYGYVAYAKVVKLPVNYII